ncbi:hypothetical protein J2W48_004566 [Flavobacterium piscis]|uniref:Uncharacterized protein n=1 Tax=Flavobacterium piscis TaxID=1114874 RepID=A0ABU1YEC5_9FLAO|nr:hypothetical protein [Flavobacterium piscis]
MKFINCNILLMKEDKNTLGKIDGLIPSKIIPY